MNSLICYIGIIIVWHRNRLGNVDYITVRGRAKI